MHVAAAKPWLETLTLKKLHRLAVVVGSPCSGTKATRIAGIRDAMADARRAAARIGRRAPIPAPPQGSGSGPGLSLLSIDMGIRNLAFAHLTAPVRHAGGAGGLDSVCYGKPTLEAWQRISVASSPIVVGKDVVVVDDGESGEADQDTHRESAATDKTLAKESFEPIDYAGYAYALIKHLLHVYKPNQIVIERQRFRSGGQAAVQEWSIRVGVFEGMLYAVLRTLLEERRADVVVEPVLPARVNRLWLDGVEPEESQGSSKRLSGRDTKRAKIDIVGGLLADCQSDKSQLELSTLTRPLADEFLSVWKKVTSQTTKRNSTPRSDVGIGKLDDLADSLLQGLAWINWQNNRLQLDAKGESAFDLERG